MSDNEVDTRMIITSLAVRVTALERILLASGVLKEDELIKCTEGVANEMTEQFEKAIAEAKEKMKSSQ